MFDTIIADEFETPTKNKKPDKEQVNRKSRNISPKVTDEKETATKKKEKNTKEDNRKSGCLSPKVIFIHYVPIPVLGLKKCFNDCSSKIYVYIQKAKKKRNRSKLTKAPAQR